MIIRFNQFGFYLAIALLITIILYSYYFALMQMSEIENTSTLIFLAVVATSILPLILYLLNYSITVMFPRIIRTPMPFGVDISLYRIYYMVGLVLGLYIWQNTSLESLDKKLLLTGVFVIVAIYILFFHQSKIAKAIGAREFDRF